MSRITESEISKIIRQILAERPNGEATIAELILEIPNRVKLSPYDLSPSPTRNGEAVWEQRVRNITSHKQSKGNAIHDGVLVAIPGGFRLPSRVAA